MLKNGNDEISFESVLTQHYYGFDVYETLTSSYASPDINALVWPKYSTILSRTRFISSPLEILLWDQKWEIGPDLLTYRAIWPHASMPVSCSARSFCSDRVRKNSITMCLFLKATEGLRVDCIKAGNVRLLLINIALTQSSHFD